MRCGKSGSTNRSSPLSSSDRHCLGLNALPPQALQQKHFPAHFSLHWSLFDPAFAGSEHLHIDLFLQK